MNNANYKKWLYSGVAILLVSLLGIIIGTYWGISSSFAALETNETASIDAVSGGIRAALICQILFTITGFVGVIHVVIGGIKAYRHSKSVE
jgi:hypothetical protein